MSQWSNDDSAANSVIWGTAQLNTTVNTANRDALFGNTTANAFVAGVTTGQFGVDSSEQIAARVTSSARGAHSGWNLRTTGSGGRAGRVHVETLVAMKTLTTDATDDAVLPDLGIYIITQPVSGTGSAGDDETVTFTVLADTGPAGGSITYQWNFANGDVVSNDTTHAGAATASLVVDANTANNGEQYYVELSASGAANVVSDTVVITVTA